MDHRDPTGRTIDLGVARRPAADPDRRIGVLLTNPGGPGASGIGFLRAGGVPQELSEMFDLVAWDPRGIGASTRIDCADGVDAFRSMDPDPDTAGEQAALEEAAAGLAASCVAQDPELLANLDSATAARDLDLLRRALGEEQVSYLGYSYGTLIGLEYARLFPSRLRAMVLDGVVDPAESPAELLRGQARAIEELLGPALEHCEGCATPRPAAALARVAARVEHDPLPASGGRSVGPAKVSLAVISAIYREDGVADLAYALSVAEEGDGTALADMAADYGMTSEMFMPYVATLCADGPVSQGAEEARALAAELRSISPRFGGPIANEVLPCAFWSVPANRSPSPVAPAGLVASLLVATTGDVATPIDDAERVAATLPGAVLLRHEAAGHTASGRDRCVLGVVRRYLESLVLPDSGAICR